ncbi:MAG: hypothetical protein LBU89_02870 [Fibromonadaceae bacterium]|nr:hypothetical protein [Fibromonadaceae bacterium]
MSHNLTRDHLPMWRWSELITDDFFIDLPPDFSWDLVPEELKVEESKAAEPEKKQSIFYYSRITTQHCVDKDLAFCEALAIAYSRILEDKSEKLFLRGNMFLAKIAKAIFEQNGNLFAEACGKYKDEKYFRECTEAMAEWNFSVDEGEEFNKESWISLYNVVLLLIEEYLATKCELPKISVFECKENDDATEKMEIIALPQSASEGDIAEAALAPMARNGLEDSSDKIEVGELFFKFLSENFPKDKLAGTKPKFKTEAMEANRLGSYGNNVISINQRLVLDAISENPNARFILLLTMLIEYGHFLNKDGKAFMSEFMEYSDSKLLKEDFMFADFIALDSKDKEQKFKLEVSGLSYEQRVSILYNLKNAKIKGKEV